MDNGIKGKQSENKFFTIEFFGVTVIITALLLLLCLFFGKNILFEVGYEVQCFILGVFGYFAYPFLITLFLSGFMILLGKKVNPKKRGSFAMFIYLLFVVFGVLTIVANNPKPTSLSEYTSFAFESARKGLNSVVAGGAFFSLLTYPLVKYLGNIFSIIILAVLTVFVVYFRIKYKKKHKNDSKGDDLTQQQPTQSQQPALQPQPYQNVAPQFNQNAYPQNNYPYQQNPYGGQVGNNVYGAPVSGVNPYIFGGQPLGSQPNGYNPQNPYGGQGYNEQGYNSQPNNMGGYNGYPNSQDNTPNISREDAMRILYGNNGMPKTYSSDFQDSFSGMGYKRADGLNSNDNFSSNGGSVSGDIPKNDMFNNYTYEDRTPDYDDAVEDLSDFSSYSQSLENSDVEVEDDSEKAKGFFAKIKDKYSKTTDEGDFTTDSFDDFDQSQGYAESDIDGDQTSVEENVIKSQGPSNEYGKNLIENMPANYRYTAPPLSLLKTIDNSASDYEFEVFKAEMKNRILNTLATFGVETDIARVFRGPAVTRFDIIIPNNIPMSKVTKLQSDLNLRIAASSEIRMIAPIPNTSYVGIEVPNKVQEIVNLKDIVASEGFKNSKPFGLKFALGKDVIGTPVSLDIADMPHLLVTGTTGSGKSVCLNTMILSLISKYSPTELRFVIVDPKRVDLEPFKCIPHMLFGEIIEDVPTTNAMLTWAVEEMENRYKLLAKSRSKNIKDYNTKAQASGEKIIPRIVIIIDEFADIMLQDKKGVGVKVCAIAQKARAAGIHLVLAAQRPSADIIEGPIKSNLPSRIVFKAASPVDSQVSLGETGAEKLLGHGDCLYRTTGMFAVERVMGAYVSDDEMYDIIDFVCDHNESYFDYNNWSKILASVSASQPQDSHEFDDSVVGDGSGGIDPLNVKAMRIGYDFGGLSASFLQRKLGVGYPRAAKIIDWLTDNGYITPNKIAGKNQMILPREEFEEKFGNNE